MVYFTGTVKLVVCEASDLKPTDFSTRLQASLSARRESDVQSVSVITTSDHIHRIHRSHQWVHWWHK